MLVTARFWSRMLLVTLQISIGIFNTQLWWRGLMALLSQCVSFSSIDVGRDTSAYVDFICMAQMSYIAARASLPK
eukprot:1159235-Pelagomonas_calceolata.AAC.24